MSDQATALRGLMSDRLTPIRAVHAAPAARRAFAIAVTSGKGGVGKSNIALNLAIELARVESAVCLLDANPGLGNIDLLCGLNGYWNVAHVVTGARSLRDVALAGPAGVKILSGARSLSDLAEASPGCQRDVVQQLEELEQSCDFLVIDAGTGFQASARRLLTAADTTLVVTTPEPTAIADAYAIIKGLSPAAPPRVEIVVNQCEAASLAQTICERLAQTSRLFVRMDVHAAGWIPSDAEVSRAVARRTPLSLASPNSPAAQAIRQLARRLNTLAASRPATAAFFAQLANRPARPLPG
jgi:flagellar biosynthesis protein FlhG